MKGLIQNKICPQCGAAKLKHWEDLTADEKFLIERLPASARFQPSKRKTHILCTRCWNEIPPEKEENC